MPGPARKHLGGAAAWLQAVTLAHFPTAVEQDFCFLRIVLHAATCLATPHFLARCCL